MSSYISKIKKGTPYLIKELGCLLSHSTPFFVAKPSVVHIWRNQPCNGRCIMCHIGAAAAQGHSFKTALNDNLITRIVEQVGDFCGAGTMVSYMGGEPLLSKAIFHWMDLCKRYRLDFRFTTNGYLLSEERAEQIMKAEPFNIGVSLESLDPAVNEAIRPINHGTEKTVRGIENLLKAKQRHVSRTTINIKCTLTQLNIDSPVEIIKRFGLTDGVFVTLQPFEALQPDEEQYRMSDSTLERLWIRDIDKLKASLSNVVELKKQGHNVNISEADIENFVRQYKGNPNGTSTTQSDTSQTKHACRIGDRTIFILNNGDVKLCPSFPALGNYSDSTIRLKDLWFGEQARDVRAQIAKCNSLCNMSCLRTTSFLNKIRLFLKT